MKNLFLFAFMSVCVSSIFGQNDKVNELISQGIALHDDGKYAEEISKYQEALSIDKNSTTANYELSYSYFTNKQYEEAVSYSSYVIKLNKGSLEDAYIILGSSLDYMQKTQKAISTYEKGLKKFPESYLLNYNLALTCFNQKEYDKAEKATINAIKLKPTHASSHLLLSSIMKSKGERIKSLLPLYYFLMLEPESKRAETSYINLIEQLNKGVVKTDEKNINVNLALGNSKKDDFDSAEMLISLLAASKYTEENKDKTEMQLFVENNKSIFSILGELNNKKNSFWWDFYAERLNNLEKTDNYEAFSYYISQSKNDETVNNWIAENSSKIYKFEDWMKKNIMK
jgi:hypothetical protein